jgi:hypothetical protein
MAWISFKIFMNEHFFNKCIIALFVSPKSGTDAISLEELEPDPSRREQIIFEI